MRNFKEWLLAGWKKHLAQEDKDLSDHDAGRFMMQPETAEFRRERRNRLRKLADVVDKEIDN